MTPPKALSGDPTNANEADRGNVSKGARSHFAINVASNMAYMALTTVAMTLYIPFLIHRLGIAVYGMVPLSNTLIIYLATITDGLNVAISRYLAIDLNRKDTVAANKTFNTALSVSLLAVVIMFPVGAVVTWLFPLLFQVPVGFENAARILFACVLATYALTLIDTNFAVSTIIAHRFDLRNLVRGLTMIARMGTAIVLFTLLPAQLWFVGLGYVLSALVSLGGNYRLWRTLTPQLQMNWVSIDRARLGELLGLSGWSLVNRIGMLLFLSTDLLVINLFLGAQMTGWYGTLVLFPELLRNLVDTVASVLSPTIMARYAVNDHEGLKQIAVRSVKLLGLALALPIGLLCGFARPFLGIWLGPEFTHLDSLLVALIGYLGITLATLPLSYVLTGYNKVRIQGVVTLLLGVVNLALSILSAGWLGWGVLGVAGSTALVFVVRGMVFLSSYSAYTMKLPWWTFYRPLIEGALGSVGIGLLTYGLTQLWWPANWFALGGEAAVITLISLVGVYVLGLNPADRQLVWGLVPHGRVTK